jgi:UPF0755 protein
MEKNIGEPEEENQLEKKPLYKQENIYASGIVLVFICFALFYSFFWSAPKNFPVGSLYDLQYGQTLSPVSFDLENRGIIRSNFWFKSLVYVFSFGHIKIVAGDYNLYKSQNVVGLAWRFTHGNFDVAPVRITIPEGLNSTEIATLFSKELPDFDAVGFVALMKSENLEGYIFPDTYFFVPGMTNEEIIQIMHDNFNKKTQTVAVQMNASGKTESDVIKMASILEVEARTDDSRKIVAGILWKRIALGMPLQVDSSFKYLEGKTSAQLSLSDLQIDSPYNSYTHKGLPPTPISNPGLASIIDAITPIKTPYLYFLTDSEGNMHYAATFAEHVANKQKYLK